MLHELAHVRRCDSLSSLLGFLCCSVFWFNPLVWLCARKLRFEAEAAADDLVLSAGVRASDYAAVLLSSISVSFGGRTQSLPAVCRMEKLGIEKRICALLDVSVNRAVVTQGWIVRAILAGALLAISLCVLRPEFAAAQPRLAGSIFTAPAKAGDPGSNSPGARSTSSFPGKRRDVGARSADLAPLASSSTPPSGEHQMTRSPDLVNTQAVSEVHRGVSADLLPEGAASSATPHAAKPPDVRSADSIERGQEHRSVQ